MDVEDFGLEYVDAAGETRCGPLEVMWPTRFEDGGPVRGFGSFKGQRNFTGWYWAATGAVHVGFESWLERDHLIRLDFDTRVVAVASQPFRLSWRREGQRRRIAHTPDYFVRRWDGSVLIMDVRPDGRIEPQDAAKFEATALACRRVGWGYRRVGELDAVSTANVRWLAGYRHPRVLREPVASDLRDVFGEGAGLLEGARAVGDPIAVLPVLFHLLWCQELVVDLATLLSATSVVGPARSAGKGADGGALEHAVAVGG